MYTTVLAKFSTIVQPLPTFRKLLLVTPSMQDCPHIIILNQKTNTNIKSSMLLTQLVF